MKETKKDKIKSIVQIIVLLVVGVLIIFIVTGQIRKPADNTNVASTSDQQMAASKADTDQEAPTATPEATKQPEATTVPTATPEATKQPEATAAPTATPEATKQPEKTAAPTATPKATKQPEKTAAPTAAPEATKQPEMAAAPTATPEETAEPETTAAPAVTPAPTVTDPPAQVHSCTWDGGSVTQAATCSSEGVTTYTCTSCGKTRTESIAKTDHSYVTETIQATCTDYGQDRTYCSICGYEKSKVANSDAPKGHQPTDYRVSFGSYESTCTYGGDYDIYCGVCGACLQSDVPMAALGHDLDYSNPNKIQEATCLYPDITEYTCKRCGEKIKERGTINPENHDWVDRVRIRYNWETHEDEEVPYQECSRCYIQRYN